MKPETTKTQEAPATDEAAIEAEKEAAAKAAAEAAKENIVFESEEVAEYAAQAAEEYGLNLSEIEGTGENGSISIADIDGAISAAAENSQVEANKDVSDFASDEAAEYSAFLIADGKISEEKVAQIKGTGKAGSITKKDLDKAVKAEEKEAAATDSDSPPVPEEAAEKEEEKIEKEIDLTNPVHVSELIETILDEVISFGHPVRGALNGKPKVLERWNALVKNSTDVKRAIESFKSQSFKPFGK